MILSPITLLREPGLITFKDSSFTSQGDIVVTPVIDRFAVQSSLRGTIDKTRRIDTMFTITFTPVGQFENLAVLLDGLSKAPGASLIGSASTPFVINTLGGTKWTFKNAAITKPPPFFLSAKRTMFGQVQLTAILGQGLDSNTQASYFTVGSESYPGDTGFDPSKIYTRPYSAAYADSGNLAAFAARDGWTITPEIMTQLEGADGVGTIDIKVTDSMVKASCAPVGPTAEELWGLMGLGAEMGASRTGRALNITSTGVYVRLYNALLQDGPLNFGQSQQIGTMTWEAKREWVGGVMQPLLYVGAAEPE